MLSSSAPETDSPRSPTASPRPRDVDRRLTYLRTWEGWLYLAAVQDAYSRMIVGGSMADHMRAELVVDALQMAVTRRRPASPIRPPPSLRAIATPLDRGVATTA